ncbi:MAG: 50S ribosomal protein L9 [Chlamydiae bacterium RIFCSPHIGHO2_12_FULL_27_8]|nr:MAG: 50S ribosomal protein L9 [Chlamydiae bacterium RIFCSPHIGHO2_12_FULL_27_8]
MKQKQKLLLIKDVEDLGKSGEVVAVKAGFARNFLIPNQFAEYANRNVLRKQQKLQEERKIISSQLREESLKLKEELEKLSLSIKVKVDPDGKMYGSVFHPEILDLLEKENVSLTKRNIALRKPIKEIGEFEIPIKLKEEVNATLKLKIVPDKIVKKEAVKEKQEQKEEIKKEDEENK